MRASNMGPGIGSTLLAPLLWEPLSVCLRPRTWKFTNGNALATLWREDAGEGGEPSRLADQCSGGQALAALDADDNRCRIANCCIEAAQQLWDPGPPPQQPERAVQVPVVFPLLMVALVMA
jgi:hypothetical protein